MPPCGGLLAVPWQLACESKSPKIMELALDAIQKLVAYGYLRGTSTVAGGGGLRRSSSGGDVEGGEPEEGGAGGAVILMDVIIQTICSCNEQQEDNVQLQVGRQRGRKGRGLGLLRACLADG